MSKGEEPANPALSKRRRLKSTSSGAHEADSTGAEHLVQQVDVKETRKLRARRTRTRTVWFGLGTFGLIGWSVAGPIILGILLGLWLDAHAPGRFSWTIALLFAGATIGCFNAWYWVSRQREMILNGRNDGDHD